MNPPSGSAATDAAAADVSATATAPAVPNAGSTVPACVSRSRRTSAVGSVDVAERVATSSDPSGSTAIGSSVCPSAGATTPAVPNERSGAPVGSSLTRLATPDVVEVR